MQIKSIYLQKENQIEKKPMLDHIPLKTLKMHTMQHGGIHVKMSLFTEHYSNAIDRRRGRNSGTVEARKSGTECDNNQQSPR